MSLTSLLLVEHSLPKFTYDRNSWHKEVARRALANANDKETTQLLVRYLLEGDLRPWSNGYNFSTADGLQTLNWLAAGGEDPKDVFPMLRQKYEESEPRCQEVWTGEHVAYRCITCGISENSCMCVYCFDAQDHEGHEYRLYRSTAGGCCDCGDPQAWRETGFCKRHRIPLEKRASTVGDTVMKGAKLACRAAVQHLIWAMRRCFFLGVYRPECLGAFGVARCLAWFSEITLVCPELCLAAAEALNERRDVCTEIIGWGNYCPAFAVELVADETCTDALLRLGCYFPPAISFSLGNLLLKLLLEPSYKARFTVDFVRHVELLLQILQGGGTAESNNSVTTATGEITDQVMHATSPVPSNSASEGGALDEEEEEEEEEDPTFRADDDDEDEPDPTAPGAGRLSGFNFGANFEKPPTVFSAPPAGQRLLTKRELSSNAKQLLDRIYCQLFHSETVALQHSDVLLRSMLLLLAAHFKECVPGKGKSLLLAKLRKPFYRRLLSQLTMILQHDAVCEKLFTNSELFRCVLDVLESCQLLDRQRRRKSTEEHIGRPKMNFRMAFGLLYELEEQLVGLLLKSAQVIASKADFSLEIFIDRLIDTWNVLSKWNNENALRLNKEDYCSAHVPLTRFYFRFLDVLRTVSPVRLNEWVSSSNCHDWKEMLQICLPSILVLNFIFQIQDNLWVRNGQTMFNSVLWYIKIFSFSTLEADLLCLRLFIEMHPSQVEDLFELCESRLGPDQAVRLFGSLALHAQHKSSLVRWIVLHCLASRNYSFSELDNQCPAKSTKEVEEVLAEIANFHDASIHPGGLPAHYTLKNVKDGIWGQVEFGRFYLRWLVQDEENALSRFRKLKLETSSSQQQEQEDDDFFPITSFPLEDPLCRAMLSSTSLRGACMKVCIDPLSQPQAKTSCVLVLIACLKQILHDRQSHGMEVLFPAQSFLDLAEELGKSVPRNVHEEFVRLLKQDSDQDQIMDLGFANPSPEISPALKPSSSSKTSAMASRAQQKALRAFAKKQKKFQSDTEFQDLSTSAPSPASMVGSIASQPPPSFKLDDEVTNSTTTETGMEYQSTDVSSKPLLSSLGEHSEHEDELICALCRKGAKSRDSVVVKRRKPLDMSEVDSELEEEEEVEDEEGDGYVSLMICKQPSSLLFTLESIALEGDGKCVAHASTSTSRCPLPESVEKEDLPYMSARSLFNCVQTVRNKFGASDESNGGSQAAASSSTSTSSDDHVLTANSVNSTRYLVHSCGHHVHESCLNRYRTVVLERAATHQPYEGQGVVKLHLNELFCPVCRRVTNDLLPILPFSTPVVQASSTTSTQSDWVKLRLEEYRSSSRHLPESVLVQDSYSREVRQFFRQCPPTAALSISTFGRLAYLPCQPAELILTQVYAAASCGSNPPSTIKSTFKNLMNLALRHPDLVPMDFDESATASSRETQSLVAEEMLSTWTKFVNDRFNCDRPGRQRRQTCFSVDLTLVLIEWILYLPLLRFCALDSPEVLDEAKRAFSFLTHFAQFQDLVLCTLFDHSQHQTQLLSRQAEERASGKQADALRAISLKNLTKVLEADSYDSIHQSSGKAKAKFETTVEQIVNAYSDFCSMTSTTSGSSPSCFDLISNPNIHLEEEDADALFCEIRDLLDSVFISGKDIPADCLPFLPAGPTRESQLESFKRHASLLFGPEVLQQQQMVVDDSTKLYLKKNLFAFVKELFVLVNDTQQDESSTLLVATTSARLAFSALLPSFFPSPSRFSSLVRLPQEFSALTVAYIARQAICLKCNKAPELPAICLSCGTLICCHSSCCKQGSVDELFMHGAKCSRGIGKATGVFLLLKSSVVAVLLGEGRHCIWGSLFLDAHDEEDRNLTRGKPLKLNMERLDALEKAHKVQSWMLETRVLDHVGRIEWAQDAQ